MMSRSTFTLASTLLLAATAATAGAGEGQPHPFVVGEPVPELLLPGADDGRPRSLAEFLGQKVVLHVFASW